MSRSLTSALTAGKVSLAVFISRILGLVREQVFAWLFGAGIYTDAWNVAFRIPNLLRDLFAEGALSSAFVPTFTSYLQRVGRSEAWHFANLVVSALLVILGTFTLALLVFPEGFVYLLAAGFREVPGKVEVTSTLIQILSPFLLCIALASVAMGMLNTLNHYFLPALAPAFFNMALILAGFLLVPLFDEMGILPIHAMGVGALAGGVLQFAVQLPLMYRHGFRFHWGLDFRHEGIRRMLRLIGPAVFGVSAVQINVMVNTQLASFLQENGPVSWLNYAFRIIYLPIGLFGVAVGVVNLREVSVFAARERWRELKETVANSVKWIILLSVPSTVGLVVLAQPVVRVLFERGDFTPADTLYTSYAVAAYALGLLGYSCLKAYVPTFYALNDTRTPVRISMQAVLVNIVLNVFLVGVLPAEYKFVGLAFGTAVSVSLNSSLLAYRFQERLGSLREYRVAATFWKSLLAALLMGMAVLAAYRFLESGGSGSLAGQLVALLFSITGGFLVYLAGCYALGVGEVRELVSRWGVRR